MERLINKLTASNGLSAEETKDMVLGLLSLVGFVVLAWVAMWVYYG